MSSLKAYGGKNIYGASVGVLMLDTRFPRIPGDIGHAGTWDFPMLYKIVRGASVEKVVCQGAEGLLQDFIDAGRELVDMGADGITTTCGFLSLYQNELAEALDVPVATSSLMQIPMVQSLLPPHKQVGVLTVSAANLGESHLKAIGVPLDTPIVGTEQGQEFSRVLINNETVLDVDLARQDLIQAGKALQASCSELGAVVLECTNMMPYAADLQRSLGVPVYSMYTLLNWFQSGLMPKRFSSEF
jgi:hypothetical protein